MDRKQHWNHVYETKAQDAVSWYAPHLQTSLDLIGRTARDMNSAIIDVGGGEATLVDDLLAKGYADVTVLDISERAIDVAKARLGELAAKVHWIGADITSVELPARRYDVWHDRAVFHFLTTAEQRAAYVRQVARSVRPGGFVIVATFGPDGPAKCSGLDTVRYDADSLHGEFGTRFKLIDSRTEEHQTPFGTQQQFMYCYCRLEG